MYISAGETHKTLASENIMKSLKGEVVLNKKLKLVMEILASEGIKGGIYFYKKGECSCCYGLNNTHYQIQGNTAGNQGGDSAGKISFESEMNKKNCFNAIRIAQIIRENLRDTDYELEWNGDMYTCMYIKKITENK